MKTDGKFIIQQGQGITQAIQQELGLSNEESKQLNSVWSLVIGELEDSSNLKTTNNSNKNPNKNNNYWVKSGAVIEFSQECWKKIVNWVNTALNKNIEVEDNLDVESTNISETPENVDVSEDKPNVYPNMKKEDIAELVKYNDIKYANQKGVKIGSQWYDFDAKGRCTRIYASQPTISKNGEANSYTTIMYDDAGEISEIYQFFNKGELDKDGNKICGVYDKDGNLASYWVESNFDDSAEEFSNCKYYLADGTFYKEIRTKYNKLGFITEREYLDENGEITYNKKYDTESIQFVNKIYEKIKSGNLTEEDISSILQEIDSLDIDRSVYVMDENTRNNLYYVMQQYTKVTGGIMLDDIAKINPNLANIIVEKVVQRETEESQIEYKYTKDIQEDMASHPNDYKKLSIDLLRIMHRNWIVKEENYGDDILNLNGKLDEQTKQGRTGDCYLLSFIKTMDSKTKGRELLNSLRKDLPNGDVRITCKGNGKTYRITKEEILAADYLSTGDDDMRVWELAMDKYCKDLAYEDPLKFYNDVDSDGGFSSEVISAFWGKNICSTIESWEFEVNDEIFKFSDLNNENFGFTFHGSEISNDNFAFPQVLSVTGENEEFITNHAYRVSRFENNRIYFTNPWDDSEELSLTIEEFKSIPGLSIEKFDFREFE